MEITKVMHLTKIKRLEKDERKEATADYISKYITDYDYEKWCEGTLTKHLENLLIKTDVEQINLWDSKDDIEIVSFGR